MRPRKLLVTTATGLDRLSSTTTPPSPPPPPPPPLTSPILPDELIVEILVRLPVRSLLQFKSVCKSWKTLISSPKFAKDHLQRSTADPTMTHPRLAYSILDLSNCRIEFCPIQPLFENPSAPTKVVSLEMDVVLDIVDIVGSCNGLLCLHDLLGRSVRLWNPCTGLASEWLKLEQKKHVTYHGFGYDHVHDKYKLLVVVEKRFWEDVTMVCTFGANSWTAIHDVRDVPFFPEDRIGKFVSGTLNWVAKVPGPTFRWVIISFDLAKETFGRLSLPDMNNDDNLCRPVLQVLRNCLCVCFDHKKTHFDVWLMKEYGVEQSWTKLVMIPHGPYTRGHPLEPLYISEDDVVLARPPPLSNLILYNSNNGRSDYPIIDSSDSSRASYSHIYYESLVSPSHCGLRSCHLSKLTVIKSSP